MHLVTFDFPYREPPPPTRNKIKCTIRYTNDTVKQYKRTYMKDYYIKNKDKIREYQKHYREVKRNRN